MSEQIRNIVGQAARSLARGIARLGRALCVSWRRIVSVAVFSMAGVAAFGLAAHPPLETVEQGEIGQRVNLLTGAVSTIDDGVLLVIPGLHKLRRFSLRDQIYRPEAGQSASGPAPFQTVEGLSIGVDVTVRYSIDAARIADTARGLPADIVRDVLEPATQGVLYRSLARYTVREVFSTKRPEIQKGIEAELKALLAKDGVKLQSVMIGKIDLPADYKRGMERLLAEELASEKMRYTLELKDKQVKQTELEAQADKVRRELAAEAAGQEQVIAAKAQAEAMKHVLPFKQKQIEQRQLEAEAAKVTRIKNAEADSQARQIEATGEAESRRKLADAESYRQEKLGKIASEQLARDGALIQKNPLLIQKTLADKLSDKISVIIAPPPANGGFIGASLLGGGIAGNGQGE